MTPQTHYNWYALVASEDGRWLAAGQTNKLRVIAVPSIGASWPATPVHALEMLGDVPKMRIASHG